MFRDRTILTLELVVKFYEAFRRRRRLWYRVHPALSWNSDRGKWTRTPDGPFLPRDPFFRPDVVSYHCPFIRIVRMKRSPASLYARVCDSVTRHAYVCARNSLEVHRDRFYIDLTFRSILHSSFQCSFWSNIRSWKCTLPIGTLKPFYSPTCIEYSINFVINNWESVLPIGRSWTRKCSTMKIILSWHFLFFNLFYSSTLKFK